MVSDDGGTETGGYSISAILIGPQTIELGEAFVSSLHLGEIQYFAVPVDTSGLNLLATITPLAGTNGVWAEGRYDAVPFLGEFDVRTTSSTPIDTYELLISPSQEGIYYFSVLGRDIEPDPGQYQIVVDTVDRHLSDVMPRSAGNAGLTTLRLSGLGFEAGMSVELRSDGLPTRPAETVTLADTTELSALFDLQGVEIALYDVVIVWPDSTEEILTEAFTIFEGIGPCLEATIDAPDTIRLNRTYVLWVEYANVGDADMPIPLFIISSPQDSVTFSLDPNDEPTKEAVQILGINFDEPVEIIPPGATFQIPIYFEVTEMGQVLFNLTQMVVDGTAINWNAVEA